MNFTQVAGQVFRFAGVGLVNSGLYFVFAAALNGLLGLAAVPSSVIAYILAATFAYQGHKHLTFRGSGKGAAEISKFVAATSIGMSLALVIPILLHSYAPMISFLAVVIVVPICSFLMMKFFVFRA